VREDVANPDVLYAGLERGVWSSLSRGAHWQRLQLNMPATSVHDLRVQPYMRDLVAGTHGRGIYIFDDLTPIEGLAAAQAARAPQLFPPRPAYAWYYWWKTQYGTGDTECCAPSGEFAAADPPYGALISYYLPQSERSTPYLEARDAGGKLVRRFNGTNGAGLNRVAWNLTEAPPAPWHDTGDWNQGPSDGPAVVPGHYTIVLHAGPNVLKEPLDVLPDPRAHWTQDDYVARYRFLRELDDELNGIDVALNQLDALRSRAAMRMDALGTVRRAFTSGIRNSEDDQWTPDRLRERLTILAGTVALSQGPPLPPHYREAQAVREEYDRAMELYRSFLEDHHIPEPP